MIVVGLTGGIGSGKTTIAQHFKALGIPVYIADDEAKALMHRSKVIKRKLIQLFGNEAYKNEQLNRAYIASKIYNNKDLLAQMNAIVHPKVASHFKRWLKKQNSPYAIKESAIIFENNLQAQYHYIITVVAKQEQRIARVLQRPNMTQQKALAIINNQLTDQEKIAQSHFVITNNNGTNPKAQVLTIDKQLRSLIKNKVC